jgi:hypothetical protein
MLLNRSRAGEYQTPSKHQSREVKRWSDIAKGNIGRNFKEDITITSVEGYFEEEDVTKNKQRAML